MQQVIYRARGREYDLRIQRDGETLCSVQVAIKTSPHLTTMVDVTPFLREGTAREILAVADGLIEQPALPMREERRGAFGGHMEG